MTIGQPRFLLAAYDVSLASSERVPNVSLVVILYVGYFNKEQKRQHAALPSINHYKVRSSAASLEYG